MSRNATEGFKDYKALYEMGVNLIFLNEPLINTSVFDSTKSNLLEISVQTGNEAVGSLTKENDALTKENDALKNRIKELEERNYDYAPGGSESKSVDAAISYIDHNNVWNRTEMEKHKPLKGLWDAMNERRFDNILAYKKVLGKSAIFKELVAAITKNRHKFFSGNFNTNPNDFDITIKPYGNKKGYIKALEDAGTTPRTRKPGPTSPTNKEQPKSEQKDW